MTGSRAAVQARFDLAIEAIQTFHTGVSEDFLLKEEKFKELRNRLLKSASDFYGKLGRLLEGQSDATSRRSFGQANFDVAELIAKVGSVEHAIAEHRRVLAYREALSQKPETATPGQIDVARSALALGRCWRTPARTTRPGGVRARRHDSRGDWIEVGRPIPQFVPSAPRSEYRLGRLLEMTGRLDESLARLRNVRERSRRD